jgi:chromosome segregation ATPase
LYVEQDKEDRHEMQQQKELLESMKARMKRLENMNMDLERRLQDQGRQCMAAERECLLIKKEWSQKCQQLEQEIEKWKNECDGQILKTEKMKEHLSRTERELYGILQKKYEFKRPPGSKDKQATGPAGTGGSVPALSHSESRGTLLEETVDVTANDNDYIVSYLPHHSISDIIFCVCTGKRNAAVAESTGG